MGESGIGQVRANIGCLELAREVEVVHMDGFLLMNGPGRESSGHIQPFLGGHMAIQTI